MSEHPNGRLAGWILLALAGLAVAVALSVTASNLSTQPIGLSGEPLRAGQKLAPPNVTRTVTVTKQAQRSKRPRPATQTTTTATTPTSTATQTTPNTTGSSRPDADADDHGGHGGKDGDDD